MSHSLRLYKTKRYGARPRPVLSPPPQKDHPQPRRHPSLRPKRPPTAEVDTPLSSLLLSHIPIHTYIYIYKEVHPPPPRSITLKPFLRGGDVAAHPLEDGALHTL
ncbi:hypothetical protein HanIR_Chr04g0195741 [Helianthus annuus]|nr:hypothetical protein HanIR_Chr04g0195741 [Helianthus annuus]